MLSRKEKRRTFSVAGAARNGLGWAARGHPRFGLPEANESGEDWRCFACRNSRPPGRVSGEPVRRPPGSPQSCESRSWLPIRRYGRTPALFRYAKCEGSCRMTR